MSEHVTAALTAKEAVPRSKPSHYPREFAERVAGRVKRPLGDVFGLSNFGVNLTTLAPGAVSALNHAHSHQDEFIYVLEGAPTLRIGDREVALAPGMCSGFKAGTGLGHHIENRTDADVVYLEIGDRTPGDTVTYPQDDLRAELGPDGRWQFVRKDGSPLAM